MTSLKTCCFSFKIAHSLISFVVSPSLHLGVVEGDNLETIQKQVENYMAVSFRRGLWENISPRALFKVQRLRATLAWGAIRYDLVEYPDGDYYTEASAIATKENTFKAFVSNLTPCLSKIIEYLRRYEPQTYSYFVNKRVVDPKHQSDHYDITDVLQTHPDSVIFTDQWTEQQATIALCRQRNITMEEYQKQLEYFEDIAACIGNAGSY